MEFAAEKWREETLGKKMGNVKGTRMEGEAK